jgi:hypothetical protein
MEAVQALNPTLQTKGVCVKLPSIMWKKILPVLPVLLLTGCAATFTNLTPLEQPRNANNLYPVEVAFTSKEQALRWDSIQPHVLADGQLYDMHQTPLVTNRWEGFVPVPPGANEVTYRYKFDYLYNDFNKSPQQGSAVSSPYTLTIFGQ